MVAALIVAVVLVFPVMAVVLLPLGIRPVLGRCRRGNRRCYRGLGVPLLFRGDELFQLAPVEEQATTTGALVDQDPVAFVAAHLAHALRTGEGRRHVRPTRGSPPVFHGGAASSRSCCALVVSSA